MKNKLIRYLCFVLVFFIHSCHHRLKMSSFSLKKINFGQLIWPAVSAPLRLPDPKSLEDKFLRRFLVQGWQHSFWKFPIVSNILDVRLGVMSFEQMKTLFNNCPPCLLAGDCELASYDKLFDQSECPILIFYYENLIILTQGVGMNVIQLLDQYQYLGNCAPTAPLNQQ